MKNIITFSLLIVFNITGFSQEILFKIGRTEPLDSLAKRIFEAYEMDKGEPWRTRRYLKGLHSSKMDKDSFFIETKQFCIDRLGEDYFYDNVRVRYHSFKNDWNTHVYTISYRFCPPEFGGKYVDFVFKSLDFLNIHQREFSKIVPNRLSNPSSCDFKISYADAINIANKTLKKNITQAKYYNVDMLPSFKWKVVVSLKRGHQSFTIDARTGKVSTVKTAMPTCGS